ncbi:MAG: hypothetical protein J6K48_10175 [Lachnospiraceae bacterium]|nr:hypothetical protein [Lachnospiraceae bacterium]
MIVVSDTTPVIALLKAGQLDLLQKLYHTVIIPEAVYQELVVPFRNMWLKRRYYGNI